MMRSLTLVGLLQVLSICTALAQEKVPCLTMAQATPFDQLLEKGHSLLSGYTAEDCACFAEVYAKKHIKEGNFALLDSEWVPIFELKGYGRCRLSNFGFDYKIVPDLFLPADDRPKARAYIERYNALMLFELKSMADDEAYQAIFRPASRMDPYYLREKLQQLVRFGQITRTEWLDEQTLQIRLDLRPLYRNLDLDWKKLHFEIIDENKNGSQYLLSLEELDKTGFPLVRSSKSQKSNVWFDFKIRMDYSYLSETGTIVICEEIKDFLYEFDHLSLTRELRLISHLH